MKFAYEAATFVKTDCCQIRGLAVTGCSESRHPLGFTAESANWDEHPAIAKTTTFDPPFTQSAPQLKTDDSFFFDLIHFSIAGDDKCHV